MADLLECVELETGPEGEPIAASVIWLHGLGADGHDFEPIVPELGLPAEARVLFVFPHAPYRPVTLNNGFVMRAWFDITGLDRNAAPDRAGIEQSCSQVAALIARENARGVPTDRIVLAGFSQGGVITLHQSLFMHETLAGVVALSTYLPMQERLRGANMTGVKDVPIFLAHGRLDPTLPFTLGEEVRDSLTANGLEVMWHEYAMGHAVCMEEITAIGAYLRGRLGL